jgi:hypothetical protein
LFPVEILFAAAQSTDKGWWAENSTLIIALFSIAVSGLLGPSVAAWFTSRRERNKDHRLAVNAERENLRDLLDELAQVLATGVAQVNTLASPTRDPSLEEIAEAQDFLRNLAPLGQRLRLRLPEGDPVILAFEKARSSLEQLEDTSQTDWDEAVFKFEEDRERFLETGRLAVQPRKKDKKGT